MKKSLLSLVLICFALLGVAKAQQTVTIGDLASATNNSNFPMNSLYNYSYSQQIYTADEINMAGTITSITIWMYGNENLYEMPFDIYMVETDKDAFSSKTDWVTVTSDDIVYSGSVTVHNTEAEAYTFELSTSFNYTGVGNLLIAFNNTTGQWKSGLNGMVFGAAGDPVRAIYAIQDSGAYDPTAPTFTANATTNIKNVIELDITPAGSPTCEKPSNLMVSDITADEATCTWESEVGSYYFEWKKTSDEAWIGNPTNYNEYTLTELESNTTYNVRVKAVCDTDLESGYRTASFTTANACAAPTDLQITDVTESSATLSWTAGYQETEWTVKYKKSTDTEYMEETINGTPTITLSGLNSCASYDVQVYNCENYISGNFITAAGIPLVEEFGTINVPAGWARYNTLLTDDVLNGTTALTSQNGGWHCSASNGVFDSHAHVNIYGNSCKYWLVTPTLPMEDNVQLTFDMALTKYSGNIQPIDNTLGEDDRFVVLITTDGGTTWEILREWNNTGSEYVYNDIVCSAIGEPVAIDLSSYAGQTIAVAFYGESTVSESGSDNNLHIDNVSIDYIPACAKPTGLAAADVLPHQATIIWTADATAWQVQLNDEDPIDVNEATYTFENLDPETTYTVKVRANCSGTYSDWTNAVSFTTTIACPVPEYLSAVEDGLDAYVSWGIVLGTDWEVALSTDPDADPAENIVATLEDPDETVYSVFDLDLGDYYFWVRAYCGPEDGYSQWEGPVSVHIGYCEPRPTSRDGKGITKVLFGMGDDMVTNVDETYGLPAASPFYGDYSSMVGAVQAGVESEILITYATGSSNVYSYGTIIWVDWDNSLSFEDSEIVYTGMSDQGSGGVPEVLEATLTAPADQPVGDYRMRIAGADSYFDSYINGSATANHSACFTSSYAVCHDYTLRVLEAPSCLIPTGVTYSSSGTEATISWTSDAEAWNMRLNGVEVDDVITNPYILTGLELGTLYSVEVQADCGDNGTSEWTNAVSFTTDLCLPDEMCAINYSFTDQYDDSWNQAYMNIVDATTGEVLYELTMPDVTGPYEGSFNVCDGREIQFVWVSGNYPRECGYTFTHNGEVILEKATNSAAPEAGVCFTYNVDCGFPTISMTIEAHNGEKGHYYLITSPIGNILPSAVEGMIAADEEDYDLYMFSQIPDAEGNEWLNFKANEFAELEVHKAYLYASKNGTTLVFDASNIDTEFYDYPDTDVDLEYVDGAEFAGVNLVGNPFPGGATVARAFYTLMNDEEFVPQAAYSEIACAQGIAVVAEGADETVRFIWSGNFDFDKSANAALNVTQNGKLIDRAIMSFGGNDLRKVQLNSNHTKVYMPVNGMDCAVASVESFGEMPVNFKAENDGTYTLNFTSEAVNFSYLHLIDNMTGAEVDLLANPTYSFEAKSSDYASRFKLVFATGNNSESSEFAFVSNGNIIVNGEGTLRVIDMTGRVIAAEQINGVSNIKLNAAAGVYVLQLNDKTQKIVIK
ncbi:MAG: fibronectin type III domain-containing protein [Bacteroidales bacterium]|nr:fibronectin type III domain-containing protein [Bacteroidales bacterium]